jgi:amino acid transporter
MKKKPTSPAVKGLIISVFLILFSVATTVFSVERNTYLGLVPLIIMVVGIVWACISYSKDMYGNVTFGNIFVHGFKTSALVAGMMTLFILLLFNVIMPEAFDRVMDEARKQMEKGNNMSEDQRNQGMAMARKVALITIPLGTAFVYLAGGAICSLIGAAVSKKTDNPVPFDQFDQPAA